MPLPWECLLDTGGKFGYLKIVATDQFSLCHYHSNYLYSTPRNELAFLENSRVIILWGHQRLFCGIIRGIPVWNDAEFDSHKILLINFCQKYTHSSLPICHMFCFLGAGLWTQDLVHAKHTLYHLSTPPAQIYSLNHVTMYILQLWVLELKSNQSQQNIKSTLVLLYANLGLNSSLVTYWSWALGQVLILNLSVPTHKTAST